MAEVVVIGPASLNQIVRLDALPEQRPHTVTARAHHRALGGTSAGKTLHLASLGTRIASGTALPAPVGVFPRYVEPKEPDSGQANG